MKFETFIKGQMFIQEHPEYEFLKTHERLGNNICLLGYGGSIAYGTNTPESDTDIRGIAINSARDILIGKDFEQVCNTETDTTVYSFNKMIHLLTQCNPNTVEILGLKPEHYIVCDYIGRELLDKKDMFLSKECYKTFGGYAYAQLRRLDNKSARELGAEQHETHVMHSIECAVNSFKNRYGLEMFEYIKLSVDKVDGEPTVFADICLDHRPLRDFYGMYQEMFNIMRDYDKLGKRNKSAIARGKLGKHQMHLVRLLMMCIDILEKHEIITYREEEHDLLMSIRNGESLTEDNQPTTEFDELVAEYKARMDEANKKSTLPDKPDYDRIHEFQREINESVVLNEYYRN